MRKVLLFSGGYDSTCLLADIVNDSVNDGSEIICVTIQHNLTGVPKLNREATAQQNIISVLKEKYPTVKITYEIIKVQSNWNIGDTCESQGLAQPIFWACNLIPLLNSEDIIYFGYIIGDQALTVIPNIKGMLQQACQIQDGKNIKVEFCTSCEGMQENNTVCGNCEPCTHLKQTLINMIISDNYNKYEKKKVRYLLKKLFNIRVRVEKLRSDEDDNNK